MKKILTIAIIGSPNVGKSTIFNKLIDKKISIISNKVQTTRNIIKGAITIEDTQLIFFDSAGLFIPNKKRMLERKIVKEANQIIGNTDIYLVVIDANKYEDKRNFMILNDLKKYHIKPLIIINKIDLVKNKDNLINIINLYKEYNDNIFLISTKKDKYINILRKYLLSIAYEGNWLFSSNFVQDIINDNIETKFIISEIIREKIFIYLNKEIPYNIYVKCDLIKNFQELIKIYATIYINKESQRKIIIGKRGSMINKIIKLSKDDIEILLKDNEIYSNKDIFLDIVIKIDPNWVNAISTN